VHRVGHSIKYIKLADIKLRNCAAHPTRRMYCTSTLHLYEITSQLVPEAADVTQLWCHNIVILCLLNLSLLEFWCFTRNREPVPVARGRSTAARLLRSWVRIPPGVWMFVCCVYCVLSGRGLCDELITRPEESYGLWRVVVCDHETSWTRRP
jgi:hypothetical protein